MGGGFKRSSTGVRMSLDRVEKAVLANLIGQLRQLLEELPKGDPGLAELGISESTEAPGDPVLARLFPDGYREDGAASGEFRRYTEASLREGKERDSELVLRTLNEGGDVSLDPDQAQSWLRVLNDLRLALGTRLELGEDDHDRFRDLDEDDPEYTMIVTYDWLTQLQDGLVHCLWGG
ncbi:DUF2017 domain-containing protein [Actinocorallia populi]|uniref:DUF2017 domain-containing protein n=1 Tax=Actinocorallia populi TaxID=2079200 RepID=UPI000D08B9EB|nr:DUF2017 domain-containing protein [Actinocorallia populi]